MKGVGEDEAGVLGSVQSPQGRSAGCSLRLVVGKFMFKQRGEAPGVCWRLAVLSFR